MCQEIPQYCKVTAIGTATGSTSRHEMADASPVPRVDTTLQQPVTRAITSSSRFQSSSGSSLAIAIVSSGDSLGPVLVQLNTDIWTQIGLRPEVSWWNSSVVATNRT